MDAVDNTEGFVVPVSVWSYKLNNVVTTPDAQSACQGSSGTAADSSICCQRRIVVLEPVNVVTAHAVFDRHVSVCFDSEGIVLPSCCLYAGSFQ